MLDLLVTYRMVVYLGGLLVIALPVVLRSAVGITVPRAVRTALVAVTLAVMVVTYLGERRVRRAERRGEGTGRRSYPLRTRVAVVVAIVGVAAGLYAALEVDPIFGLLFVGGALLFARLAFRDGEEEESRRADA
ncbi:hypothetical protein ACFQPA_03110 [Halomarina halobia]|uniref:Uncharacterized protein n=1 Tax=Halomarina halobia TaxID=3033386 RepID=A0ABD6A5G5_9EURY|nr:hypothetical protein [Halomarina sp. PSR21]